MTNQPENARQKQPEGVEHRSVTQALLNEAQHVAQVGLDTVIIATVTQHVSKPKDPPKNEK